MCSAEKSLSFYIKFVALLSNRNRNLKFDIYEPAGTGIISI